MSHSSFSSSSSHKRIYRSEIPNKTSIFLKEFGNMIKYKSIKLISIWLKISTRMTFVDFVFPIFVRSVSSLIHSLNHHSHFKMSRAQLMAKLQFHWIQSAIFLIMSAHYTIIKFWSVISIKPNFRWCITRGTSKLMWTILIHCTLYRKYIVIKLNIVYYVVSRERMFSTVLDSSCRTNCTNCGHMNIEQ